MMLTWFGMIAALLATTMVEVRLVLIPEDDQPRNLQYPLAGENLDHIDQKVPHEEMEPIKHYQRSTDELNQAIHKSQEHTDLENEANGGQIRQDHRQQPTNELSKAVPLHQGQDETNTELVQVPSIGGLGEGPRERSSPRSINFDDPLEKEYGPIIHASLIFRHGDRNPIENQPLDMNLPLDELGQLINSGKTRMYHLGQWFKNRYRSLTGDLYYPDRILVQSSDIDRTIMSAMCFLYGYYPTIGPQVWLANDRWQPIPVHTISQGSDNMIQMSQPCSRLAQIKQNVTNGPEIKLLFQQNRAAIDYISRELDSNFSNKTFGETLNTLGMLADILIVRSQQNQPVPAWTKRIFPQPLMAIYNNMFYLVDTLEADRLIAGPILKSIRTDMLQKITNTSFNQTLHVYSGHDTTIAPVMLALNISNGLQPPYAATLMFELRKKGTKHLVTVSYKNSSDASPYLLNVPGCGFACTLETFLSLTTPLISTDWEQECSITTSFAVVISSRAYLILIAFFLFLFR